MTSSLPVGLNKSSIELLKVNSGWPQQKRSKELCVRFAALRQCKSMGDLTAVAADPYHARPAVKRVFDVPVELGELTKMCDVSEAIQRQVLKMLVFGV